MDRLWKHGRALLIGLCVGTGCGGEEPRWSSPPKVEVRSDAALSLRVDRGVDLNTRTIRLGVLNDESGPAAAIGRPYAAGKRLLAAQINAGDSGLLPPGFRIELVERDHGYNPQRSVQLYREIKDDVLMIAHSFGSPNTLPLRPMLERDHLLALPAALSSSMTRGRFTIPAGPTYAIEAMRGMDYVVADAEANGRDKASLRPAIVYQQDDYGQDSLDGLQKAATHYGIALCRQEPITSVQRNFDNVVLGLKDAGATHVWLAGLPGATAGLLNAAARLDYRPVWLGNSPSWSDRFFEAGAIAPASLANFAWINGLPYWGEDVPGMARFLEVYQRFGTQLGPPDHYMLFSYMQGLLAIEIIRNAMQAGVLTRDGMLAVLGKIRGFDSAGLGQPIALDSFPYRTSVRTRVLRPLVGRAHFEELAGWAAPTTVTGPPAVSPAGATAWVR